MTFRVIPAASELTNYTATDADIQSLADWFAAYDDHSAKAEIQKMADMADFPINLVTDGSDGNAWTGQWGREEFLTVMSQVSGDGSQEITFDSVRTPFFITAALAIVFTTSTMTTAGQSHTLRYADILVKKDGSWTFQTMVQGGWADMLTGKTH